MSTRATYGFKDKLNSGNISPKYYCYIHYDGYPSGAAMYFYATLINPSKGNFATQFIRANRHAELTSRHEAHGDTEFKYDITGNGPEAIVDAYDLSKNSAMFFTGTLHEFITLNQKMIEDFKPFKLVQHGYHQPRHMNELMAAIEIANPLHHLQVWKGRYEGSGNWQSCVKEVQQIVSAFPSLMTDEIASFGITVQEEPVCQGQ